MPRARQRQDPEDVANVIAAILEDPERLPLPLERIRPALLQHYVADKGAVYWVGTGRMTPFLQRLADAADDGLNPDDYPIDALMELRDSIEELTRKVQRLRNCSFPPSSCPMPRI
jgi:L,D-transpeptidase YcbB